MRIDSAASAWAPDAAARLGLEDIGGISNPLALAAYETYAGAVGARGSPLYNFLNAQFVLADKGHPPGDSSLVPVFDADPTLDVYLNTNAQPRLHLVYRSQIVARRRSCLWRLHAPQFDPASTVVIDASGVTPRRRRWMAPARQVAGERNLFYTGYAPENQTVVVHTPAPAYLVLSEVWYPGWRAWIDGVEVPIYQADLAFRAVFLPRRANTRSRMRFHPLTLENRPVHYPGDSDVADQRGGRVGRRQWRRA